MVTERPIRSIRDLFAANLAALRAQGGRKQREIAALCALDEQSYRHIEAGRRNPPPEMGDKIDEIYGVPANIMGRSGRSVREDRTPIGDLREYEQTAQSIRIWEHRLVPGLLQTEEYARAVLGNDAEVQERLDRQRILRRRNPVDLRVVLDESVLWRRVGTSNQFYRQLLRLAEAPFPLHVVPMLAGYHTATDGPFIVMEFRGAYPVVWREANGQGTIADTMSDVDRMRAAWEHALGLALSPDNSREMIRSIAEELPED